MDETVHILDKETEMAKSKKDRIGICFAILELICRLLFAVVVRFWKLCSSSLVIILLAFWFAGGILAFFLFLLAILGLLYNAQDMLLYYPDQPPNSRTCVEQPSILHLPFENHLVKTRDGTRINLVLVKQPNVGMPTIVFFHGNAGNIGHRLMNVFGLYSVCRCNVLMVEYRGYGKSEGLPSEKGFYEDAEAAVDFLVKRSDVDKKKIFVFGRSLGGGVAINLVSKPYYSNLVAGLILENTFSSLPDIAKKIFSFKIVESIPEFVFKNKYPSKKLLKSIRLPTLFMSGLCDHLVPPNMMTELHEISCSHMKRICRFQNGTHNETWTCSGYYENFAKFLVEVLENQKPHAEGDMSLQIDPGIV